MSLINVLNMLTLQETNDLYLSASLEADDNAPIIDILFSTDGLANSGLWDDDNDSGPIYAAQEMLLCTLANKLCTTIDEQDNIWDAMLLLERPRLK